MTAALIPTPVMQFLDADGNPLVGGKVYTYAAGTSTPLATFTDYGGATPNANPVILNSRGEASIWFGTAAYKLELYTAATVLIWTADNVSASTPVVYGTGVAAALAINVGTAGSILVNGGVLGTPSSGLVTNLTGTASININGTVGATTANTGEFTTISASGTATMAAINASGTATLSQSSNSELDIAFFRNTSNGASAGTWVNWGNDAGVASGAIVMSSSTNTTKPAYFDIFNRTNTGPLRLGTNNTARLTIDSAGAVTIPGTLSVTGALTAGTAGSSVNTISGVDRILTLVGQTAASANAFLRFRASNVDKWTIGQFAAGGDQFVVNDDVNATIGLKIFAGATPLVSIPGTLGVGTTSTGSDTVRVSSNGATSNQLALVSADDASGNGYIQFRNSALTSIGSVARVGTTNAVVYNTTSDYRLKTVVGAVTGQGARIDALKPIDYQWIEGGQQVRGFLAHEFQAVYSNSVTGTKDAVDEDGRPVYQAMQAATSEVIADLVAELQSLRARLSAANIA